MCQLLVAAADAGQAVAAANVVLSGKLTTQETTKKQVRAMMETRPLPEFEVANQWYDIVSDQVNIWDSCNRRKGRNRDSRGPQTVDSATGEATKVKARLVSCICTTTTHTHASHLAFWC